MQEDADRLSSRFACLEILGLVQPALARDLVAIDIVATVWSSLKDDTARRAQCSGGRSASVVQKSKNPPGADRQRSISQAGNKRKSRRNSKNYQSRKKQCCDMDMQPASMAVLAGQLSWFVGVCDCESQMQSVVAKDDLFRIACWRSDERGGDRGGVR